MRPLTDDEPDDDEPPLTLAEIDLAAIYRVASAMLNVTVATAIHCAVNEPSRRMIRTTARELLRLSVSHGEAEQRAKLVYPIRDHF